MHDRHNMSSVFVIDQGCDAADVLKEKTKGTWSDLSGIAAIKENVVCISNHLVVSRFLLLSDLSGRMELTFSRRFDVLGEEVV